MCRRRGWRAATGAHSIVRHALGMEFAGSTLLTDFFLADVHIAGMPEPAAIRIYWHADGILALFPLEGTRHRLIADAGKSQGPIGEGHRPPPTLEDVQQVLNVRGPGGLTVSNPVWLSSFSINERKVEGLSQRTRLSCGRCRACTQPGRRTGHEYRHAGCDQPGVKLALVERGLAAPDVLLESYSEERSATAKLVLEATTRATAIAITRDGIKQSIRNHVASLIFGFAPVQHTMANLLSDVLVSYSSSPLNEHRGFEHAGAEGGAQGADTRG